MGWVTRCTNKGGKALCFQIFCLTASKAATVGRKHASSVISTFLLTGTFRSATATLTKMSPQNITLPYHKIIPSCSRHTLSILKMNWHERFYGENRE